MDSTEFQPDRPLPPLKRRLPYVPTILRADPVRVFHGKPYAAVLLDNVQTISMVRYRYVFVVFEGEHQDDPHLIISSELFAGGPKYAVGVFSESGHETLSPVNDDWADIDKFCRRALDIVEKRKGVSLRESKPAKPWWKLW